MTDTPTLTAEQLAEADRDFEQLLEWMKRCGECGQDHYDDYMAIVARWRNRRGEAGKAQWIWWARINGEDVYTVIANTREEVIEKARQEFSGAVFEICEARYWNDDLNEYDDEVPFAEVRNREVIQPEAVDG